MKKLVLAVAFSLTANAVFAGGVAEAVMPQEEVAAQASSSAGTFIIPLLLLVALAIAASNKTSAPVLN